MDTKKVFTQEEIDEYQGKEMEARIVTYSLKRGYGFARTTLGKDIFVSSYQVKGRTEEALLFLGTKIKFKFGTFNDKICATDIEILEEFPSGNTVNITTDEKTFEFPITDILKIGISNLLKKEDSLLEIKKKEYIPNDYLSEGYTINDYHVLFVEKKNGEVYRFFNIGSKLKGCGQVDTLKTYSEICDKFYKL